MPDRPDEAHGTIKERIKTDLAASVQIFERKSVIFLAYVYFVAVGLCYFIGYYRQYGLDIFKYMMYEDIALLTIVAWFGPFAIASLIFFLLFMVMHLSWRILEQVLQPAHYSPFDELPELEYFEFPQKPVEPSITRDASSRMSFNRVLVRSISLANWTITCGGVVFRNFAIVVCQALLLIAFVVAWALHAASIMTWQLIRTIVHRTMRFVRQVSLVLGFVAPVVFAIYLWMGGTVSGHLTGAVNGLPFIWLEGRPNSHAEVHRVCTLRPGNCIKNLTHIGSVRNYLFFVQTSEKTKEGKGEEKANAKYNSAPDRNDKSDQAQSNSRTRDSVVVVPLRNIACIETVGGAVDRSGFAAREQSQLSCQENSADKASVSMDDVKNITAANVKKINEFTRSSDEKVVKSLKGHLRTSPYGSDLAKVVAAAERTEEAVAAHDEAILRGIRAVGADAVSATATATASVERSEEAVAALIETTGRGARAVNEAMETATVKVVAAAERTEEAVAAHDEAILRGIRAVGADAVSATATATASVERSEEAVAALIETTGRGARAVNEAMETATVKVVAAAERTEEAVAAHDEAILRGIRAVGADAVSATATATASVERSEEAVAALIETTGRGARAVNEAMETATVKVVAAAERTEEAVAAHDEAILRGIRAVGADAVSATATATASVERSEEAVAALIETTGRGARAVLSAVKRVNIYPPGDPNRRKPTYLLAGFDDGAHALTDHHRNWLSAFSQFVRNCGKSQPPRIQLRGYASGHKYETPGSSDDSTQFLCRTVNDDALGSRHSDKNNCQLANRRLSRVAAYLSLTNNNPNPTDDDIAKKANNILQDMNSRCKPTQPKFDSTTNQIIVVDPWCELGSMKKSRLNVPDQSHDADKQPHFLNRSVHIVVEDPGDCKGL